LKWLLIGGWIAFLIGAWFWWEARTKRKVQIRIARQRAGLDRAAYIADLYNSGVGSHIAGTLYDEILPYCVEDVLPHPDDGFVGFYMTDGDGLLDLLSGVFPILGLQLPPVSDTEIGPNLESARHLAIYLQGKLSDFT
jgi:hypothetical protein